jgi:CelD/BcsL family acetyltransferase involved in cellulose biosynthesis
MTLRPSARALWDELAGADSSATFFQTRGWHELAAEFEGTETVCMVFEHDGCTAVLPLQKRARPWGDMHAAPFGTYATFLCGQPPSPLFQAHAIRSLSRLHLNLPGSPFATRFAPGVDGPVNQTRTLPLEGLDPDAWAASWSRNHKRLLRQAREYGYSVRTAETAEDISRYYDVYAGLVERWGSGARRVYPERLFQEMFRRWGNTPGMNLLLAEKEGVIVAGRLCLYHNRHAVEWHAAANRDDMERGANHLLVHAAVLAAAAKGYAVYDFNPNPGLPAVDHFKRGFGAKVIDFTGWRQRPGLVGLAAALRDRLRRS